jgi:inosine-uridine nucleoside N-ribohydrolase
VRSIILDVDTGFDDAVAIALALSSRDLNVVGISTVCGNRPVEESTENTLRVVDAMGKSCPVFRGSPVPLVACLDPNRKPGFPYTGPIAEHGVYLDLPESTTPYEKTNAVSWLIDVLEATEEPVTIVGLAPVTNLAAAFRVAPRIIDMVEGIWLLGGGYRCGNVTPVAEFNFWVDPEAAQIVLKQPVPITVVTINAAYDTRLTRDECLMFDERGSLGAHVISRVLRSSIGDADSIVVYDALAICALLVPGSVDVTPMKADIDISGGISDGQFVAEPCDAAETNLAVALHADKRILLETIHAILNGEQ